MRPINICTNAAMARTLPAAGKAVTFYNQFDAPFIGKVEFNRWYRPIFYMLVNNDWCRINFVPKGWDELDILKEAGEYAGEYADMPTLKGATE